MLLFRRLACSFCSKRAAQVSKLVQGRHGYICDVCAAEAHRIMSIDRSDASVRPDPSLDPPMGQRSWIGRRLKRFLRLSHTFDPLVSA
jgi:ATP-dependent protease Clp ATPase subunit